MHNLSLDNRLQAVAKLVRPKSYFADIGTDHGYLPVYLVQNGNISRAIAADIHDKPLQQAEHTIQKYRLRDQITLCLSDGLDNIDPAVTDIAIAGMGGEQIAAIIGRCDWIHSPEKRLIVQPMTKECHLRIFLSQQGYHIEKEVFVEDNHHLYTVMLLQFTGAAYDLSAEEAHAGKSIEQTDPAAIHYLSKKCTQLRKIADGYKKAGKMEKATKYQSLAEKLQQYYRQNQSKKGEKQNDNNR